MIFWAGSMSSPPVGDEKTTATSGRTAGARCCLNSIAPPPPPKERPPPRKKPPPPPPPKKEQDDGALEYEGAGNNGPMSKPTKRRHVGRWFWLLSSLDPERCSTGCRPPPPPPGLATQRWHGGRERSTTGPRHRGPSVLLLLIAVQFATRVKVNGVGRDLRPADRTPAGGWNWSKDYKRGCVRHPPATNSHGAESVWPW